MIRSLKNVSANPITLTDLQGLTIDADEIVDGLVFGEAALRKSVSVSTEILAGTLVVLDGFQTYTGLQAIDLIRGTANQVTPDGKIITTTSDRPQNTVRYFTSKCDNFTTHKIGEGEKLDFDVAAGATQYHDMKFIDSLYIKDGYVAYKSMSNFSWLSVTVVCPAGMPFPAPGNNTGNYDHIGNSWVANTGGTGAYFILGTETTLYRFANCLPMTMYTNKESIIAPEPQALPSGYILRITCFNGDDATENLKAYFYIGGYRTSSV